MDAQALVLAGVAGLLAGLPAGYLLGRWLRGRREPHLAQQLQRLARGEPWLQMPKDSSGEAGTLLRQAFARQATLTREASDARFDLRAILAALDDGVLVADHRCLITLINPSLRTLFGLKGDPVGQTVLSTLRLPILQTMLAGVLQDGAPQQAEVQLPGRGAPLHVVLTAAPLRDAAGLPGALVVASDVSRLRRLEEMRREFVADVSHELRTPLSIFHGYLENLLETPEMSREEVQGSLQIMRKHSLRLNALVEDLLALARLESGRDPLQPEKLVVAELLEEVQRDWEQKGAARGVRVALEVTPGLPELRADPMKLNQVLDNLLDNALKYTPAGGVITLGATLGIEGEARPDEQESQLSGTWVDLSVEDTGAGVPREDLPHIFQRFYRADKARSRELGGTGLGLAIVKHIAQAHGGSVRAESEVGKGTRVVLRLPVGK